jgi:hypothetical protein
LPGSPTRKRTSPSRADGSWRWRLPLGRYSSRSLRSHGLVSAGSSPP